MVTKRERSVRASNVRSLHATRPVRAFGDADVGWHEPEGRVVIRGVVGSIPGGGTLEFAERGFGRREVRLDVDARARV